MPNYLNYSGQSWECLNSDECESSSYDFTLQTFFNKINHSKILETKIVKFPVIQVIGREKLD